MRICIDGRVIADHFPGIGRYAYQLVDALAAAEPSDAIVLLCNPAQLDAGDRVSALTRHENVSTAVITDGVFSAASVRSVPAALRDAHVDVYHATYWLGGLRTGVPTVLSVYDLIAWHVPGSVPPLRRVLLGAGLRLALHRADHVVTLSESSRRDLSSITRVPGDRVTVTPLAADDRFHPARPEEVAEMRVRLGLPPTYVLYLGINKPHKNLRTLVAAWGLVGGSGSGTDSEPGYGPGCAPALGSESGADSGPVFDGDEAAQLVLAGRWDDRYASVVGDASRLAPVSSVRFLGPVTEADLRPLYSGAAAFAFPSRYEGFGLPPLEAMACGTPVVASDSSSLPEVVGDAGLLVPADDVAAWADALRRVLADRALAADLRRRSLLRAATFGWGRTARLTRSAYVRTAAGASGSAQQE